MLRSVSVRLLALPAVPLLAALLLAGLLLGPAPAVAGPAPPAAAAGAQRTLLIVGDSLSAEYGIARGTGWVTLLERRLRDRRLPYAVVNASVSGETTAGGRTRLPDLLTRLRPAVVLIELGANDALRGLPLATTEANLRRMLQASRAAGARTVLVGMRMPPNYGRAYADQFAAIFRRVAEAEKASLVPFLLDGIADRIDYFQADRIHPTEQAQPILLETVWPTLSQVLAR